MIDGSDHSQERSGAGFSTGELGEILESAADFVMEIESEGTIRRVSSSVRSRLGYRQDHVTGRSVRFLFPTRTGGRAPFTVDTPGEFHRVLFEERRSDDLDIPLEHADGSVVPYTVSLVREGDRSVYCVCNETDFLRNQERADQYRGGFDAVGDPMFVLDSDGFIQYVNAAMVEYTGYDRGDLVGRNMVEIMPISEYEQAGDRLLEILDSDERSQTFETTMVTKEGEPILSEANVTAITDGDGVFVKSVGVLRDIRERKRREQDLNLLKQVLTRVFRHNIRNELMVVQGHAEVLDEQVDQELRPQTKEILTAADRLLGHSEKARLIKEAIETDDLQEVDISSTVVDLVEAARDRYPDAAIEADIPDVQPIVTHPDIPSAIEELIENAILHSPADAEPTLRIWLSQRDDCLTLFVEDESGGLEDNEIKTLQRGAESDLEHSSGVGLWLVRWLVEYSGGDMIVHQTDGGTLMGIKFYRSETGIERLAANLTDSPLVRNTDTGLDASPDNFRGETIVERTDKQSRLEDAYKSTERNGGQAVLVSGESGIGKTTFVERFQEHLANRDDSPIVAKTVCESNVSPPYHAFRQIIEELPIDSGVSELLDEFSRRRIDDSETAQRYRRVLFADVADEVCELAADEPVVLVIEDLQWADHGTLSLLEYLIDEVLQWTHPVLFVGTYRTSGVGQSHPLQGIRDEIVETKRLTDMELGPFEPSEVQTLLSSMFDIDDIPEPFVDAVYEHTGGTPLFVNELGHHLTETLGPVQEMDELPGELEDVAVPESVEIAVAERLASLPDRVNQVLRLGAVIGTEITFDVLRAASDQSADTLVDCIDTLVDHHVWTRSGGTIKFDHGVVREQALDAIGDEHRQRLHSRVATAIETVHDDSLEQYAARLGSHYEQAGDVETAFEYYVNAGDDAASKYAYEEAIDHYERAVTITGEQDDVDATDVAAVYAELGDTFRLTGEIEQAQTAVKQGLSASPENSEETCRLLGIDARCHQVEGEYRLARETATRQHNLASSLGARHLEAEANENLGKAADALGELEEAHDYYEQALAIRRDIDDRRGEAASLNNLGSTARRQGQFDQAREYHEASLDIQRQIDHREGEAKSLYYLGVVCQNRGAYDEAIQYFQESLDIHEEVGNRHWLALTLNNLGNVAHNQGNYERARELHERSRSIQTDIGNPRGEAMSLNNLGNIAYDQGEYEKARERYQQSLDIQAEIDYRQGQAINLHNLGNIARSQGKYEQAKEYYERSLEIERELGNRRGKASALDIIGNILQSQGEYDRAREYHVRGLEINEEIGNRQGKALSLNYLGSIASARGKYEQAQDRHERALHIWQDIGERKGEASTLQSLGTLARHIEEYDSASERLNESLDIAQELSLREQELECLYELGALARERGRFQTADQYLTEAASISETIDNPLLHTSFLLERTELALSRGEIDTARTAIAEAKENAEELGARHLQGRAWLFAGHAALASDSPEEAIEQWQASLEAFEEIGAPQDSLEALDALVTFAHENDDTEQAQRWCARATAVLDRAPEHVSADHEDWVNRYGSELSSS